jgi:hypothetical protein
MNLNNISQDCCPGPKEVPWSWSMVINQRSKSLCSWWLKHCPGYKFSLKALIGIFHRTVTLDAWKCHDFHPRWLVKGQGHNTNSDFWHCPNYNFSLSSWIGIIFHRIVTLDSRKCHDLDPRSLVKSQGNSITLYENLINIIETNDKHEDFAT